MSIDAVLRDISRDLAQIYKRLEDIELTGFQSNSGLVPAAGTQYNHLEDSGVIWTSVTDLTLDDDAALNFGPGPDGVGQYVSANNRVEWTGVDWLFDGPTVNVGEVGGGGERLALRIDQNANTAMEIVNANGGATAAAVLRVKNVAGAGASDAVTIGVTGTGWTPIGKAVADMGVVQSQVNLAGGLLVRVVHATAPLICAVNSNTEIWRADPTNGLVVNEDGNDQDFRLEWNTGDAFFVQGSDGKVLFNTATEDPNILATTKVQVIDTRLAVSQDGVSNAMDLYAYGTTFVPKVTFKHARGTRAAPTATQSGDFMGAFDFTGYGAAFYDSGGAQISGEASENWAVGNRGANLVFSTTPSGAASGFVRARIQNSGELDIVEYLRHLGDTDTSMRFQDDQWTLACGGVTMIDAVEAASDYLQLGVDTGVGVVPAEKLHIYDATDDTRLRIETDKANGAATIQFLNDARQWNVGVNSSDNYQIRDVTGGANVIVFESGSVANTIHTTSTGVGIKAAAPGSLMEWNMADQDLEFVDAHAATGVGSINAVVEAQVGGVTTYLVGYNSYS